MSAQLPNLLMMLSPLSDDPTFVLSPPEWDFGRVMINNTVSQAFTITNGGGGTLTVTGMSPMSVGPFTIMDAPAFPVSLTLGQTATFNIQYAPTAAGEHTATFTITDGRATTELVVDGECFDPSITTFPYLQNFDGDWVGTPAAPEGWTVVNANTDGYTWRRANTYISPTYSPPYAAHGMGNTDDWLITPPINLTNMNVRMKWWDKVESSNMANSYKVKVSTTTPDITSFGVELLDVVCANTTWTEHTLALDAYNGQTIYLAFHQYASPSTYYGFGIDDVLLEEIPSAPLFIYAPESINFGTTFANTPTDYQNVTVTNTGLGTLELTAANVSIVGDNAAMFEFDPVNLPFALTPEQSGVIPVRYNPTAEGAHSAILRMAYGGENYDVELDGVALGEFALFEGFEDTTFPPVGWSIHNGGGTQAWQRSTSHPHSGVAHAQLRYDSVAHDDWLITPKLAPTAANSVFSFYGSNNSTYYDERFNVLVSTTTPDIASFTNTVASDVGTGASDYMFHSFDLSQFIGQQIYVGIQAISTNQLYLQIDDVAGPDIVSEMPAAPVLVSPADNATMVSTTPTFTWAASPGGVPTGFRIYCDTTNPPTTEVGTSASNSFQLTTPLETETVYYWTVKAYNSSGTSDAATAFSFTTVPEGLVFIGDGTANTQLPIYPWYNYSYSQTIYLQSDINVANQRIENIAFYWNGANVGTNSRDWVVYMAHTDRTAFTSNQDWVPFDQLTQVFSGELDIPAEEGWINIALQSPFIYNNTDNLLICVDENTPSNSGSSAYFYSTNVTDTRALLYYSDSTNPDPATPPNANSQKSSYANIRMQFGDLPTEPIFAYYPESLGFGTVSNGVEVGPLNVTITNTGAGTLSIPAAAVSIIGPQAAEFSFDDDNLPMALTTGVSATIPVYVTGTTEGPITATLRIVYGGENYDVALSANVLPAGTVMIGDGTATQRQPFGTLWGFEHSAALYTADAIGLQGPINVIGWDCATTTSTEVPYKIFLKNTTDTEITASTWTDFSADLIQVKEGTHSFDTAGWNVFTLDTLFVYTGGNLIVATESTYGGSGGGSGHTFKYTSTPASHGYWYSDGTFNPDQTCPVNANRPNLLLGFGSSTGSISGTVTGANNQPLAGVSVNLAEREFNTTTNDAGQYEFLNINAGNYTLTMAKELYQTHTQNVVLAGGDELVINVTMQPLPQVTVSGIVLASDTGAGIAGAAVTLTGFQDYTATTTATGAFTIPNVYANNVYEYNIVASGYEPVSGEITVGATNYDMGQITLVEIPYPPVDANAVANAADTEVTITWSAPDPDAADVTRSFERDTYPSVSRTHTTIGTMPAMEVSRDRQEGSRIADPGLSHPREFSRFMRTERVMNGYIVFRLTPGEEDNEAGWTLVNQEPTTELSVVDPAWENIENGDYRWAVKAVYSNDVLSVPCFTNTLNKFVEIGYLIGTVKDMDSHPIVGATVTAGDYSATTDASGAYSITLPAGTYDVTAEAKGYNSLTLNGCVVHPDIYTPVNFILEPVSNDENTLPVVATMLNGNYPNPFNPETTISYSVKEAGHVKLEVYNVKGQLVKTLVNEDQPTGHYKLVFNAKDDRGRSISSGVYMLRMTAPGYHKTTKMILMQ